MKEFNILRGRFDTENCEVSIIDDDDYAEELFLDGVRVLYHFDNYNDDKHVITEPRTGYQICTAETKEEAIATATKRVNLPVYEFKVVEALAEIYAHGIQIPLNG
jgi:hypothetical protein